MRSLRCCNGHGPRAKPEDGLEGVSDPALGADRCRRFLVELWTRRGLQCFIVLFFIDLSTRQVEIARKAAKADGFWMSQIARSLTDAVDGFRQ